MSETIIVLLVSVYIWCSLTDRRVWEKYLFIKALSTKWTNILIKSKCLVVAILHPLVVGDPVVGPGLVAVAFDAHLFEEGENHGPQVEENHWNWNSTVASTITQLQS